jgi:hypothetical protein
VFKELELKKDPYVVELDERGLLIYPCLYLYLGVCCM